MLLTLLAVTVFCCALAYRFYGAFLERRGGLEPDRPTPAHTQQDGIDFVPTRASVVFGHHFSSIAGAGPIVGPIVAAAAFGWGPTWLWILLGSIFVGGVHDFGSTLISVRNRGQSIVQTCRDVVGEGTGRVFLLFVLLTLVYIIVVFLDLTAQSFVTTPAVATASGWFVLAAFAFGAVINRTKLPFGWVAGTFIVLTFAGLWIGHLFPAVGVSKTTWLLAVLAYCGVAAVLPVQTLMQPRDFLSATFLYAILAVGLLGVVFHRGGFELPAYTGFTNANLGMMVPFLFITVACGACSGFHSIVASGTTSKQISSERDIRKVAYGGMLVEGILAVFAVGCLAVVGGMQGTPVNTFAQGAAIFFNALGLPMQLGVEFATLAVSTFLLTTLDTCTRLGRFLVEELLGWRSAASRYLGTLAVLAGPAWLAFQTFPGPTGAPMPAWQALWPLFGATNQLLAALALVTFVVFLKSRGRGFGFALPPAVLMVVMPLLALALTVFSGASNLLRSFAGVMFVLGLFIITMGGIYLLKRAPAGR